MDETCFHPKELVILAQRVLLSLCFEVALRPFVI